MAVLKDLLADVKGSHDVYGAFFFDVDKETSNELTTLAEPSLPRFEFGTSNLITTNFYDKVTMKPAVLFWVKILSLSDDAAEADGGYALGLVGGVGIKYELKRSGMRSA